MRAYTRELVTALHGLTFEALPGPVVAKAKELFLDYLGYASTAAKEEPAAILWDTVIELGGRPECTVIGHAPRTSCLNAALVNGAMGHMAELDDTHRHTQSHVGDSVIPAALAIAERRQLGGKPLLGALVAGYEAAIRIGESVMPTHYVKGWHPSGTVNTFGAAVAAGKLLGLDPDRLLHAVGLAGAQAAGNFAHIQARGMAKDFNPGRAAANGVLAALLAQRGFSASTDVIENERGFWRLYADNVVPACLTEGLGTRFEILEVAHKPAPGCRCLHSSRDATLDLCERHGIAAPDIERITLRIYTQGAKWVDDPEPWSPGKGMYGPRFSAQFNAALAALEGRPGIRRLFEQDYMAQKLDDPAVRELMGKVTVVHDDVLMREFPHKWASVVEITTRDGRTVSQRVDYPKGEPENPMSHAELVDKYRILAGKVFSEERVEGILEAAEGLESLLDCNALTRLLEG
jgi:2-methylcitrate dehydratase PrpD